MNRLHNRRTAGILLSIAAIAGAFFAGGANFSLFAAEYIWTSPSGGNWSDAGWSLPGVPGIGDTAVINQNEVTIDSNQAYASLYVAVQSGATAGLTMTGGNVTYNNSSPSEFVLGKSTGNATFNMSGGSMFSDSVTVAGEAGSTAVASYWGDARHTMNQLLVANGVSVGQLNLGYGAAIRVTESAVLGVSGGTAEVVQTGGNFIIKPFSTGDAFTYTPGATLAKYGLFIGRELSSTADRGTSYAIENGLLQSYYDVTIGDAAAPDASHGNTRAALDIRGGSVEIRKGVAGMQYPAGASAEGNLNLGYYGAAAATDENPSLYSNNSVNIYGGELLVEGKLIPRGPENYFNVFGSEARSITLGGIEQASGGGIYDTVKISMKLDSNGVTPLNIGGTLDVAALKPEVFGNAGTIDITMPGFLALRTSYVPLITAGNIVGLPSNVSDLFTNKTGFQNSFINAYPSGGKTQVDLHIGTTSTWDMTVQDEVSFFQEEMFNGSVYIRGDVSHDLIVTLDIQGDWDAQSQMSHLLNFLNEMTMSTGVHFLANNSPEAMPNSLILQGDYLNQGDAWFGWYLDALPGNHCDFTIGIMRMEIQRLGNSDGDDGFSINTPEPATWVMLLAGFGFCLFFAYRKRNAV